MADEYEVPESLVERLAPIARQVFFGKRVSHAPPWKELSEAVKDPWRKVARELLAELKVAGLLNPIGEEEEKDNG